MLILDAQNMYLTPSMLLQAHIPGCHCVASLTFYLSLNVDIGDFDLGPVQVVYDIRQPSDHVSIKDTMTGELKGKIINLPGLMYTVNEVDDEIPAVRRIR